MNGDTAQIRRLPEPKPVNAFDGLPVARQSFAWNDLIGQDKWITTWTPTLTGWTLVGTPTVTGRYKVVGRLCIVQVQVVPGTTTETTLGTSYIDLPVAPAGYGGFAIIQAGNAAVVSAALCHLHVIDKRLYPPTIAATAVTWVFWAEYEV